MNTNTRTHGSPRGAPMRARAQPTPRCPQRWGDAVEQSSLLQAYCLYYLLAIMTVSSGETRSLSELVRFREGQVEYFRGHGRLR